VYFHSAVHFASSHHRRTHGLLEARNVIQCYKLDPTITCVQNFFFLTFFTCTRNGNYGAFLVKIESRTLGVNTLLCNWNFKKSFYFLFWTMHQILTILDFFSSKTSSNLSGFKHKYLAIYAVKVSEISSSHSYTMYYKKKILC